MHQRLVLLDPKFSFLTNDMKYQAREKVNKEAGTRRMFSHAIFTPGHDGWLDKVEEEMERLRPDSWKGYTIGDNTNKHLSKWPFRLDDRDVSVLREGGEVDGEVPRPARPQERLHPQRPLPALGRAPVPHLLGYCNVNDVGQAAKDWPQLNFVIYHRLPLGRGPGRHRRRGVGPAAARGTRRLGHRPRHHPGASTA